MTRIAFAVALFALACGGGDYREFGDGYEGPVTEAGSTSASGAGGALVGAGGLEAVTGGSDANDAGEPPISAGGSPMNTAGAGGSETTPIGGGGMSGGTESGGSAGATATAGSGGQAVAGGAMGGNAGQAGSAAQGGSGGEPEPIECAADRLDCTDEVGCETWKAEHDHCGSCGHKCGVTQVCKIGGSVGAWTYYCQSP